MVMLVPPRWMMTISFDLSAPPERNQELTVEDEHPSVCGVLAAADSVDLGPSSAGRNDISQKVALRL